MSSTPQKPLSIPSSKPDFWKSLGPGLLWAGAAIGVSHLVQSTRAGASYGYALVWAVVLVNLFKYPFFEFGPRYAAATGETLIEGYQRLGKWAIYAYLAVTFATMFSVQAAVTIVTAGLAMQLFNIGVGIFPWCGIIIAICILLLLLGRYPLLDSMMKIIIIILTLSTLFAVGLAVSHGSSCPPDFEPPSVWNLAGVTFLVALMGWMPAPIDVAVWHSVWTRERFKQTSHRPSVKEAILDFKIGFFGTAILAFGFLLLGALVMYGTGETFSEKGIVFAGQLVSLYTKSLGAWSRPFILIAAFTTLFSTTLTVTDAFPRVLLRSTHVLFPKIQGKKPDFIIYFGWMALICSGALLLLSWLSGSLTFMVDLATIISFVTAPLLGYMNYKVILGKNVPEEDKPGKGLRILSWAGLAFLILFNVIFIVWRFGIQK